MDLNRKAKGDLVELRVATDLLDRGYKLAFPFGEDFGDGCNTFWLRLRPARNNQAAGIHRADAYLEI